MLRITFNFLNIINNNNQSRYHFYNNTCSSLLTIHRLPHWRIFPTNYPDKASTSVDRHDEKSKNNKFAMFKLI